MTSFYKFMMIACCVAASACSSNLKVPEQVEQPVDVLYNDALATAMNEDPKKAAPKFEEVERQHPYSALAVRASDRVTRCSNSAARASVPPRTARTASPMVDAHPSKSVALAAGSFSFLVHVSDAVGVMPN